MSRGSAPTWDPDRYLAHVDERGRPFVELAAEPDYAACTEGVAEPASHDPQTCLRALQALGCEVDAWETTYLHVLDGEDPVVVAQR